jgi:hypothetical protein
MITFFIWMLLIFKPATKPADVIISRFHVPDGYKRTECPQGSFGYYLQHLSLKPAGTPTRTYDGKIAGTNPYTAAVVDISVGNQDLQQCADAVMRLRGEYLYQKKEYKAISFNFTSGFKCDYIHYADGYRYQNEKWIKKAKPDYGYKNFMKYMTLVFSYAGTLSLQKELLPVTNSYAVKPGDVFIYGGSPGHCFIVVDVAENAQHLKVFMLAQSYIPAQNIQVLKGTSEWFDLGHYNGIPAEQIINAAYLKKFAN